MSICQYCCAERPDDQVLEFSVNGEKYPLHRGCEHDWRKAMEALPASSVVGIAPGRCCQLCGSGRNVYRIRLPGEKQAEDRHKPCAGRYWLKKRRRSSRHDYNCHIGSPEWKRFRDEVIKQRGNRCERCGQVGASLELHHKHYHSLGSERPEDVELLCPKCHEAADEARVAKNRLKQKF